MEDNKGEKVYNEVIEAIKDKIKTGELKKGDKLPSERELCEVLSVSRTSVREAMKALEVIGLIERKRGSGNYICTKFNNSLFEPISVMFMLEDNNLKEMFDLRESLEILCIKSAIKNVQEKDIDIMSSILEKMYDSKSEEESLRLDIELHYLIVNLSKNILVINILEVISQLMDEFIRKARMQILYYGDNRKKLLDIHENIVVALKDHDERKAHEAVKSHFELIKKAYGYE